MIYVLYGREEDDMPWTALVWSRVSAEDARAVFAGGLRVELSGYVLRPPELHLTTRAYDAQHPDATPERLPAKER